MFNYGKLAQLQLVWGASMYIFYSVLIYMANFSFLKFRMQVKKSNVIFLFLSQSCFDCCKNIFSQLFLKLNLILVRIFCCVQLHFCSKCVAHVRVHLYIVNLIVLYPLFIYLFVCFFFASDLPLYEYMIQHYMYFFSFVFCVFLLGEERDLTLCQYAC